MSNPNIQALFVWLMMATASAVSDPFVGTWKLNPSKSQIVDIMKIEAAAPNKYALTFAGATEPEIFVADGTEQPGRNGTTFSIAVETPGTWKVVRKRDGRTLISATWTLAADGKSFHDAFTLPQADGSTMRIDAVYARTTAGSGFVGTWEATNLQMSGTFELQIQVHQNDGLSFVYPAQQRTRQMKFDGRDYPDTGRNVPAGSAGSGRRVNARTLKVTDKMNGKVTATQDMTVSPDLKTLTITAVTTGQSKPNVLVFDRQ